MYTHVHTAQYLKHDEVCDEDYMTNGYETKCQVQPASSVRFNDYYRVQQRPADTGAVQDEPRLDINTAKHARTHVTSWD